MRLVLRSMTLRMVQKGQSYAFEECRKNNRKDDFEQYLSEKLAALLLDCCRNVADV